MVSQIRNFNQKKIPNQLIVGDSETNQKGIYSIEKERLILSTVSTEDQRSLEDNNGIKTEPTELEWAEMELTQSELDNSEIGNGM